MVECHVVVVGRCSESGNVALRVQYEGSCLTQVKQLSLYRTRSATLPRSEPLPTTTTGDYTICCKKKPQACTPEDGQRFARNMLS